MSAAGSAGGGDGERRRRRRSRAEHAIALDRDRAGRDEPQRPRIEEMLLLEHARARASAACRNRAPATAACATIGPSSISGTTKCTVQPWIFTPSASARSMRVQAAIGGQQGRVDVEHAVAPLVDEPGRQQPHEAGEAQELDAMGLEHDLQRALELFAAGVNLVIDGGDGDAQPPWPRRGRRRPGGWTATSAISAGKSGARAASISASILEPRPEIRIAVRSRRLTAAASRA